LSPTKAASRSLSYAQAINEALRQSMELSEDVVLFGQLVDYKSGIFGTTSGLVDQFGTRRVQDFPVSENLMTATAMGAALLGLRPVIVHQRLDFMIYSLDAIANWLALWHFKSAGKSDMPVTIRAIVGKGWGQGPQHSKSLHAWFAHLPGLRVAVPATADDAKGLLMESIFSQSPAIFIEGRSLFSMSAEVPDKPYRVPFGQSVIRRAGNDVTLVAIGNMVPIALRAAANLAKEGIEVEVVDPRTISPLDSEGIFASVGRTRRLVVTDPAWHSFGTAAEIVAKVAEEFATDLKAKPARVCLPDSHTPMSLALEREYYPDETILANSVKLAMGR
jgi:acetoin:2,6-dichlorophenolindophenol oxidoreductase subunit beta